MSSTTIKQGPALTDVFSLYPCVFHYCVLFTLFISITCCHSPYLKYDLPFTHVLQVLTLIQELLLTLFEHKYEISHIQSGFTLRTHFTIAQRVLRPAYPQLK